MTPQDKKYIQVWYSSGAVLIVLLHITGGITRLWGSFFAIIFFLPFVWFLIQNKLNRQHIRRAFLLLFLWLSHIVIIRYLATIGIADIPYANAYRHTVHLLMTFIIFGTCVWFAFDIHENHVKRSYSQPELLFWIWLFFLILIVQISWGGLVSGHHAGHIYNTFPTMFGYWFPQELWLMEPPLRNFIDNMVTVQWIHRVAGMLLIVISIVIWIRSFMLKTSFTAKKWALTLLTVLLLQYLAGVFTLIYHVPAWLGMFHQILAFILFGVALGLLHYLRTGDLVIEV